LSNFRRVTPNDSEPTVDDADDPVRPHDGVPAGHREPGIPTAHAESVGAWPTVWARGRPAGRTPRQIEAGPAKDLRKAPGLARLCSRPRGA